MQVDMAFRVSLAEPDPASRDFKIMKTAKNSFIYEA